MALLEKLTATPGTSVGTPPEPMSQPEQPAQAQEAPIGALAPLPHIEDPRSVAPADAKELSYALFDRLALLEEGTREYSYVRATLIELNMSLVSYAAGRFRNSNEPMEDILQVGTIGLIKAIDRFEPGRGLEFTTYALPTISGEIKRHFRDTTWSVHVPRRLQELRLKLAKAKERFEHEHGRPATPGELSAILGVDEDEVVEGLRAGNGYTAGSLDLGEDPETGENPLLSRMGEDDPSFDTVENVQALKPLIAQLTQRERLILSLRFCEDLTQSEIGERIGVSQMHVSRLLARILNKIRAGLTDPAEAEAAVAAILD